LEFGVDTAAADHLWIVKEGRADLHTLEKVEVFKELDDGRLFAVSECCTKVVFQRGEGIFTVFDEDDIFTHSSKMNICGRTIRARHIISKYKKAGP
jgi:hypothetical protein